MLVFGNDPSVAILRKSVKPKDSDLKDLCERRKPVAAASQKVFFSIK